MPLEAVTPSTSPKPKKEARKIEVSLPLDVSVQCEEVAKIVGRSALEIRELVREYVEESFKKMPSVGSIVSAHLEEKSKALKGEVKS